MLKPEPKLNHMPLHIKQKITDSASNVGTKLALSQMSKEYQSLAEDSPIKYDKLAIEIDIDKVAVIRKAVFLRQNSVYFTQHKKHVMEFSAHEDGVLMKNPTSNWQKILPEMDYRKAAVQYCLPIMKAKTEIGEFKLTTNYDLVHLDRGRDHFPVVYPKAKFDEDRAVVMDEIGLLLPKLKHRLIMKKLRICFPIAESAILQILLCLEPGTLQEINLGAEYLHMYEASNITNLQFGELSETAQWKGAKKVNISTYECDFPHEKWTDFEYLSIALTRPQLTMKEMIEKFVSRQTFKSLSVGCSEGFDVAGVTEYLDQFDQEPAEQNNRIEIMAGTKKAVIRLPNEPNSKVEISYNTNMIQMYKP